MIRQVLGHSTEAMTRRYLSDFGKEALQDASRLMIAQLQGVEEKRKQRTYTGKPLQEIGVLQKWIYTFKAWWESDGKT